MVPGIEAFHLGALVRAIVGRIEEGDRPDAAATGLQRCDERRYIGGDGIDPEFLGQLEKLFPGFY